MSKAIAKTASIASGATASDVIDTLGMAIAGIKFPATFTGATVSVQFSLDGTNFHDVKTSAGGALTFTKAVDDWTVVDPYTHAYAVGGYIKLISASTEGGARTIDLILVSL
tara:strand:- start:3455 stop:3787 length:333 start_codon:yes stop_codon:yes gene_type:complete